jgi:hypothetical protein
LCERCPAQQTQDQACNAIIIHNNATNTFCSNE